MSILLLSWGVPWLRLFMNSMKIHPCRPADRKVAKYELMHSVRSHIGADDDAFNAIRQREDEDGIRGIILQRNVVPTAATALKTNIASLAPLVLPFTELVRQNFIRASGFQLHACQPVHVSCSWS